MPTIPTAIATATAGDDTSKERAPATALFGAFHLLAGCWVVGMLVYSQLAPEGYRQILQEDRFIEWWTATLFAAAAYVRFRRALPGRRVFDLLVAVFCVFVAGEEFSWGQRLLGFTPPAPFLEHNRQQELNLHNFAEFFGQPKGVLILAVLGYGLLLPALRRSSAGARLLERIGASSPPVATIPWFFMTAAVLYWYPVAFTGEWSEALAGALFLVAAAPQSSAFWRGAIAAAAAAGILTLISARGLAAELEIACARAEVAAILSDIVSGDAARARLRRGGGSVHKRVWTSIEEGYLSANQFQSFERVTCEQLAGSSQRRRYAIDPWGTSYWIRVERPLDGTRSITVYSMGPNRRRDSTAGVAGDDITVAGALVLAP